MHRRGYLGAVVATVSTALAGCGILGGNEDGPAATAKSVFTALNEGDTEEASEYLPDRYDSAEEFWGEENLQNLEEKDFTFEGTEVVEKDDDEATVDLTYSVAGNQQEQTDQFELERNDDEWVVFAINN